MKIKTCLPHLFFTKKGPEKHLIIFISLMIIQYSLLRVYRLTKQGLSDTLNFL